MNGFSRALAYLTLALTTACGGGGGGPGDGAWLTFTPAAPSAVMFLGEGTQMELIATSSRTISEPFSVLLLDESGKLLPDIQVFSNGGPLSYRAILFPSPALGAGNHAGRLQVRLCYDDPAVCRRPLEGSPWYVNYSVRVIGFDLRPLDPVAGVADWSTAGRDAANNRYVAMTLDLAHVTRRFWGSVEPAGNTCLRELKGVATGGDLVFVSSGFSSNLATGCDGGVLLTAFDERTGVRLWTRDFGQDGAGLSTISAPATSGSQVFVNAQGKVWAFDGATGAERWSVTVADQATLPLVAEGDGVYALHQAAFGLNDLAKYLAADGTSPWTRRVYQLGPPVARDGLVFIWDHDAGTGTAVFAGLGATDGTPAVTVPTSLAISPDQGGPGPFIALSSTLVCPGQSGGCFDPVAQSAVPFGGAPFPYALVASDGARVLGYATGVLGLLDQATGEEAWSRTDIFGGSFTQRTLTDSHVVAGSQVFDRTTAAEVAPIWGDQLWAISPRGVGYFGFGAGPNLYALNLR